MPEHTVPHQRLERRTGEVGAKRTCLVHWTDYGGAWPALPGLDPQKVAQATIVAPPGFPGVATGRKSS